MTSRSAAADLEAALVDDLRRRPDGAARLVELLPENLPRYAGRTSPEMTRVRGYLLAAFADTGLPDDALPFVLESLETGVDPYEVAGAAIALRGSDRPPAALMAALVGAIDTIAGADATVDLTTIRPASPPARPTTALREIVATLGRFPACAAPLLPELERLGRQHDRFPGPVLARLQEVIGMIARSAGPPPGPACCGGPGPAPLPPGPDGDEVLLQDQDGVLVRFADYFAGEPSVVTFLYTRCDNPAKCSATVTGLAALQQALDDGAAGPVRLGAITYDPDFDLPERLRRYGTDRGLAFGPRTRFFRAVSGFARLRGWFDLAAGFGPSTVSRHAVELFVLDRHGRVVAARRRGRWNRDDVVQALAELHRRDGAAS